ncbi:hypothetical protein [Methylobacterium goesingense]|uniref:Uncharacterized protein n=1 Tax=Methylobacterium goesingense TaxID=243690 RepID=A0ABV2LBY1_9HYPH|nr:hypothetical protein [Methylobacterium goesingense]GJD73593.1 hypothetical protein CFIICLFH_1822 [Methylobacterium goesingense]
MRAPFPRRGSDAETKRKAKARLPVYRAMCELGTGVVFADPGTRRFGPPSAMPFVAIFDDQSFQGPSAFDAPSLYAVLSQVQRVVVLTSEPTSEPYAWTATLLPGGISALVVETDPAQGEDWYRFIRGYAPDVRMIVLP